MRMNHAIVLTAVVLGGGVWPIGNAAAQERTATQDPGTRQSQGDYAA